MTDLQMPVWDPSQPYNIIGISPVIRLVHQQIGRVAKSDYNVVITGETGVGKELVARNLHAQSPRSRAAFIPVNCGGISESLLESELFGYEANSFTGASTKPKKGKIEMASGGTLFLDEVGELSTHAQLAFLRALETKAITRVGGHQETPVDFRILSATNVDLEQAVSDKKLRQDFYYRLNVVRFHIPPLRERKQDLPLLAAYFMDRYCQAQGIPQKSMDPGAISLMESYPWPGNIRELENLIKRSTLYVEDGVVTASDIQSMLSKEESPRISADQASFVLDGMQRGITPDRYEDTAIRLAFEQCHQNQSRAARLLGYTRDQLRYRLNKIGLLGDRPAEPPQANPQEPEVRSESA